MLLKILKNKRKLFLISVLFVCSFVLLDLYKTNKAPVEKEKMNKTVSQLGWLNENDKNLNYNVHLFYYAWYGNPEMDGHWWHWDHKYIPPWDKRDHHKYPTGHHAPPEDIGSCFYPKLGPYSSLDPIVVSEHMRLISSAGIGVISVSWYPPGMSDENGPPSDKAIPLLLEKADEFNLKVSLHIEPYANRSVINLLRNLDYIHKTYANTHFSIIENVT